MAKNPTISAMSFLSNNFNLTVIDFYERLNKTPVSVRQLSGNRHMVHQNVCFSTEQSHKRKPEHLAKIGNCLFYKQYILIRVAIFLIIPKLEALAICTNNVTRCTFDGTRDIRSQKPLVVLP